MRKNLICATLLGVLFVLCFIIEDDGLTRYYPENYAAFAKVAICGSLFLLPVIFSVILYGNKDKILYGILIGLTVMAVLFNKYMPFLLSLNYLPVMYLSAVLKISKRNKKDDHSGKKIVVLLYVTKALFAAYMIRLILPLDQDNSFIKQDVFGIALLVVAAVLICEFVLQHDKEDVLKNNENVVWIHYLVSLALKIFVLSKFVNASNLSTTALYTFYSMRFWLFMPDFLFLVCFFGLNTERKLNLKFITESMSEN